MVADLQLSAVNRKGTAFHSTGGKTQRLTTEAEVFQSGDQMAFRALNLMRALNRMRSAHPKT